jgi:hypothetical protein
MTEYLNKTYVTYQHIDLKNKEARGKVRMTQKTLDMRHHKGKKGV